MLALHVPHDGWLVLLCRCIQTPSKSSSLWILSQWPFNDKSW